ncbi:uncharacterized protein [Panulirus ornatus]|uniref:uncharacterized protein isoform X5 n=1 Tax=Panulirus ornatus TaxID=150431 RepID=UPI003A85F60D
MNNRCLLLLLPLAALMAVYVGGTHHEVCEPDCTGRHPGDLVADPLDCTQYYVCLADGVPSAVHYHCPSGSFDPGASDCTGPELCASVCTPKECPMTCRNPPEYIADPKDCRKFYVCTDAGVLGPYDCPSDKPFFGDKDCGTDHSKCCSGLCYPYCFDGRVNIPDPLDCTKYYRCLAVGAVEEDMHLTCPEGQSFDIPSGECAAGSPCTLLCDEAAMTTSRTSTTVVTPTSGCLTSLICTKPGYFAQCQDCRPDFFYCSAAGVPGSHGMCTGGLVFNPVPSYPYCISPASCPYYPIL